MKYKESCQLKAAEMKKLQDQVAYFRRKVSILRNQTKDDENPNNKKQPVMS